MAVTEDNKQLVGVQPTVPVVKPNAFAVNKNPIMHGNATPKQSKPNNDMQFLDAVASGRLAQRDYENQVAEYNTQVARKQAGDPAAFVGEAPQAPNPFLSKTAEFNRQQQAQEANQPNPGRAVPYEEFRQKMQERQENEEAVKANKRAMVYAIGDALRQMGNLYYTTKGAVHQDYGNVNMAKQTLTNYKQERAQREAKRYQEQKDRLAQRQLEYENGIKARVQAREDAKAESEMQKRTLDMKKTMQDMNIQLDKYPYEKQKLVADTMTALANCDIKTAEAQIKKLELENTPEALKLANALKRAQTSSAYASARNSNAQADGHEAENKDNKELTLPKWSGGKYNSNESFRVKGKPADVKEKVVSHLADYANKKGWLKGGESPLYIGGKVDLNDLMSNQTKFSRIYDAIVANASDKEVQRVFEQLERESGGGSSVSHTGNSRPGTLVKSGKSYSKGSGKELKF